METKSVRGVPYILSVPPGGKAPFWIPAIKITTWSPDTCYCTVNYWWDRRVPDDLRVHMYCSSYDAASVRPDVLVFRAHRLRHRTRKEWRWDEVHCAAHAGLEGDDWFETLLSENRARIDRKEEALAKVTPRERLEILAAAASRQRPVTL